MNIALHNHISGALAVIVGLLLSCSNNMATSQETSILAPADSTVGAIVSVTIKGEVDPRNFMTIVLPDTPEGKYEAYQYTRREVVELTAPTEPGAYEIRLLAAERPYRTIWRQPLQVIDVVASINAPDRVNGGAEFELTWTGPNNSQDFITIVPADTLEGKYERGYRYTSQGSPLKIVAPETAGVYELRYLMGASPYRTLGRRPLIVGELTAAVTVPPEIKAGAQFTIHWEGPDNQQDFLTIVAAGTPDHQYASYVYTSTGNPATLLAPEEPGAYEVRYLTGQNYTTLAKAPIELLPVSASVSGPETVEARSVVVVSWEGPNNPQDYVVILPRSAENRTSGNYAYTARSPELRIQAPDEPGDYELRYLTGRKQLTLATQAVTVTPRPQPGRLQVVDGNLQSKNESAGATVVVVLDASGSMLQRIDDRRRIDIAKEAVSRLVEQDLQPDVRFSLRVFGHKEKDSCRTDVEIPLGPLNRSEVVAKVASVNAMNLAKTPIADTLSAVATDLAQTAGPHLVILLTDGEETCGGDPAAVIQAMADSGLNVRVNIVGFAIDELMLRETFQAWARLGDGQYFDAHSREELTEGLSQAINIPFQVVSVGGDIVEEGTVNGPIIELATGEYTLRTSASSWENTISVTADELTVINLKAN